MIMSIQVNVGSATREYLEPTVIQCTFPLSPSSLVQTPDFPKPTVDGLFQKVYFYFGTILVIEFSLFNVDWVS